jgi:hypothetical protein
MAQGLQTNIGGFGVFGPGITVFAVKRWLER